ncbi:CAZyme family CE16 [Paecilomyces variotii]|nr:CAZyme family CE16 [Paecilomyces variotii]KAJ9288121.1 CAZyme family CE16 [Paecilomyces variotii]KAJ9329047.1 CAZyme family CE16 [Paecilomyces variotii]KAJ9335832.1 CAZyme family CE16 [Paecilomyces variotii]
MKRSLSLFLPALVLRSALVAADFSAAWKTFSFTSLVAFGDSYTDESRLKYFEDHNGEAPPVGWVEPINNNTSSGGYIWPRLVANDTGVNLYNYAVNGAVCSNKITPRWYSTIHADFPSTLEYSIPAYVADSNHVTSDGEQFLNIPPFETAYAVWLGGNDLGVGGFLDDAEIRGKTIPDYVECIYQVFDKIYQNGGRFFVLMNSSPMQLAPLFATPENGGVGSDHYWIHKPKNITEVSYRMQEHMLMTNDVYKYKTPYELLIANRYPGAHFAIMDTNSLITDMYHNADEYLNSPVNITGYLRHCGGNHHGCENLPSNNNFFWWDELHPTQSIHAGIAEQFVAVVNGTSQYATYWG